MTTLPMRDRFSNLEATRYVLPEAHVHEADHTNFERVFAWPTPPIFLPDNPVLLQDSRRSVYFRLYFVAACQSLAGGDVFNLKLETVGANNNPDILWTKAVTIPAALPGAEYCVSLEMRGRLSPPLLFNQVDGTEHFASLYWSGRYIEGVHDSGSAPAVHRIITNTTAITAWRFDQPSFLRLKSKWNAVVGLTQAKFTVVLFKMYPSPFSPKQDHVQTAS